MKTAKLVIDKNIGEPDIFAQMFGEIATTFSSSDMSKFLEDNVDAEKIDVEIRSNGGSVTQGFEIYDLLKNSGKTIKTIAYKANSIATVIFLAGSERVITKNAQFVIHNPFIDAYSLGFENLTADDLQAITNEIRDCEEKIFNLYNEVLNLDERSQTEIKDLMKADTDLTSDKALKYGFATAIINGEGAQTKNLKQTAYSSKIAAILKEKSNNNNMDNKENKEIKSQLDKLTNGLKNMWKALNFNEDGTPIKPQNSSATAADGTVLYFTEGSLAVGVAVFSDEAMTTPATDGTFNVDGSDVVVKGGVVETIETIEDAKTKMTNLETENTSLKAELENLKAANATIEAANLETVNQLKEISTEFQNLKKLIPNDVKNIVKGNDNSPKSKAKIALENMRKYRSN